MKILTCIRLLLLLHLFSACIFMRVEEELPPIYGSQTGAPALHYVWPNRKELWFAEIDHDSRKEHPFGSGPTFSQIKYALVQNPGCIVAVRNDSFDFKAEDCAGEVRRLRSFRSIKPLKERTLKLVGAYELKFHPPLRPFSYLCVDIVEAEDGTRAVTMTPQNIEVRVEASGEVVDVLAALPFIKTTYCPHWKPTGRDQWWPKTASDRRR